MRDNSCKKTKLTIGRLAHATGVNITTVRYYQKRGLLRQPESPTGGFRYYGEADVERMMLIKQAQNLGFTLSEISELIPYVDERNCLAVKALAERKLLGIKAQIRNLQAMRKNLGSLLSGCPSDCCDGCPLMQKLLSQTFPGAPTQ